MRKAASPSTHIRLPKRAKLSSVPCQRCLRRIGDKLRSCMFFSKSCSAHATNLRYSALPLLSSLLLALSASKPTLSIASRASTPTTTPTKTLLVWVLLWLSPPVSSMSACEPHPTSRLPACPPSLLLALPSVLLPVALLVAVVVAIPRSSASSACCYMRFVRWWLCKQLL